MITFNCECGQKLKVDDKFAGKKIRCPKCKSVSLVPSGGDPSDVVSTTAPTQKMRSAESAEFDFKTLPKLKALDDLVDVEDEEEEDALPPPTTSKIPLVFGILCALVGFSAAVAFGVLYLPGSIGIAIKRADAERLRPPEGAVGVDTPENAAAPPQADNPP